MVFVIIRINFKIHMIYVLYTTLTCMTASSPETRPPAPTLVTEAKSIVSESSLASMSTITWWSMQNSSTYIIRGEIKGKIKGKFVNIITAYVDSV